MNERTALKVVEGEGIFFPDRSIITETETRSQKEDTMVGLPEQQHIVEAFQESTGLIGRCVRSFGYQAIAFLLGIALAFM